MEEIILRAIPVKYGRISTEITKYIPPPHNQRELWYCGNSPDYGSLHSIYLSQVEIYVVVYLGNPFLCDRYAFL